MASNLSLYFTDRLGTRLCLLATDPGISAGRRHAATGAVVMFIFLVTTGCTPAGGTGVATTREAEMDATPVTQPATTAPTTTTTGHVSIVTLTPTPLPAPASPTINAPSATATRPTAVATGPKEPTLAPTDTPHPTSPPPRVPTRVRTPTPGRDRALQVTLLSPADLAEVSISSTFAWQTSRPLAADEYFELVVWAESQTPESGMSPIGAIKTTSALVHPEQLAAILQQSGRYRWGVFLLRLRDGRYERLDNLTGDGRSLIFTRPSLEPTPPPHSECLCGKDTGE